MKRIVLFLSGLVTCAVLAASLQGWHHAPLIGLADPLQKGGSEARMREEERQEEQSSMQVEDEARAEQQAAEADRRAKQALAPFNH